jgi:hypothetical protein
MESQRDGGHGGARLGRLPLFLIQVGRDAVKVVFAGSNPLAPTTILQTNQTVTATSCSTTALGLGSLGSIEVNEAGTSI